MESSIRGIYCRLISILLMMILPFAVMAQSKWLEDKEMNFRIEVPQNYSTSISYRDSAKILTIESPGDSSSVKVYAWKIKGSTLDENQGRIFIKKLLPEGQQLITRPYSFNGITGLLEGYRLMVKGATILNSAFLTLQNNVAYLILSSVPETRRLGLLSEIDAITCSFSFLNFTKRYVTIQSGSGMDESEKWSNQFVSSIKPVVPVANGKNLAVSTLPTQSKISITDLNMGSDLAPNLRISDPRTRFSTRDNSIRLVFGYTGNAEGRIFTARWINVGKNQVVQEMSKSPRAGAYGRMLFDFDAFITNREPGLYRVETLIGKDYLLTETYFIIE